METKEDLNYWKNNAEEDYITTPISVLKYISKLEEELEQAINYTHSSTLLKEEHEIIIENFEGIYKTVDNVKGIGFECMKVNSEYHYFINGELVKTKPLIV